MKTTCSDGAMAKRKGRKCDELCLHPWTLSVVVPATLAFCLLASTSTAYAEQSATVGGVGGNPYKLL